MQGKMTLTVYFIWDQKKKMKGKKRELKKKKMKTNEVNVFLSIIIGLQLLISDNHSE